MSGIRLEVDAHILTGLAPAVKNLEKCVLQSGVDINDIIPNVIAAPEAVLSKRQKELGVVVLDIGHSSSSLAIYEEGTILASHIIPVGGESVTNDIAIGLRTAIDTAERVKIEYGTCQPQEVPDREMIDLSLISKNDFQQISRRNLAEIIQARYHELFTLAKEELKNAGRDGMLPAGVILTGAAVKIPGIVELARDTLNLPVQIGFPQNFEGIVDKIDDPAYATAIGLLIWGSRFESVNPGLGLNLDFKNININKMLDEAKGWLKNLLP
jgi:cell division protein FtsA